MNINKTDKTPGNHRNGIKTEINTSHYVARAAINIGLTLKVAIFCYTSKLLKDFTNVIVFVNK